MTPSDPGILSARATDLGAIRELLAAADLPDEDLTTELLTNFLVARGAGGGVLGCVGLELYGDCGLLRSLVVRPELRGQRFGRRLVAAAEALARERGVTTLYLLTTTAAELFASLGYTKHLRSQVPPAIAATTEFRTLCPSTAVCMAKELARG